MKENSMAKLSSPPPPVTAPVNTLNDDTNALAARLDRLEIAEGSTVSHATIDAIADVSARLKALGAPVPVPGSSSVA